MRLSLPSLRRAAPRDPGVVPSGGPHHLIAIGAAWAAIGLRWVVPLSGEGSTEAALRRLASKAGGRRYLRVRASAQNQDYFAFLVREPPRKRQVYSLAAWFAASYKDKSEPDCPVMYLRPTERGIAICCATAGEPDPELDRLVTEGEALDLVESQRRRHLRTRIVVDREFGDLPAWLESVADFCLLDAPLEFPPPASALLRPLPVRRRGAAKTVVMWAIVLGGAGFVLYEFAYAPWEREQQAKTRPPPVPPEEAYRISRDALWTQRAPQAAAATAVRAMWAELANLPTHKGGWVLTQLACEAKRQSCALTWQSAAAGTYQKYANQTPGDHPYGAKYVASLDLKGAVPLPRLETPIPFDTLPLERDFFLRWGTRWQQINSVKQHLNATAAFTTPALLGVYNGQLGDKLPGRVLAGTWTLTLPLGALYMIEDLPPNMTLQSLTLKLSPEAGASQATAQGAYYVR